MDDRGFVFAASGQSYTTCAVAAAKSLRRASPDLPIDIFTDSEVEDSVFDRVHPLRDSWFRPKLEALVRTRFARTVVLDSDIFVVADISDIFEVLTRFDVAAAQVQNRNQRFALKKWRRNMPNAFPQINSGVLGIRKSAATDALFTECQRRMQEEELPQDQPVLRELLFDSDLRLAILPPEYNARDVTLWRFGTSKIPAPRVLHRSAFHGRMTNGKVPTPEALYGRRFMRHVERLVAADRHLTPGTTRHVSALNDLLGQLRGRLFPRR
ncbi:putative nucleotide-diphospho-sugar transferase [Pelagovum pacificum]|uniref:Nucleotide-diphospho-sugar transferase domain-containing protein n=1 Tax=Pelagovum pacificum TaxID=2588711 RepID=A0A5C5GC28_9RHOB|nr:putative nucleotide-diphospho-sugar transferase [Pelagovum pacificum]QQA42449.1 hypothetical protein I8N54_16920 [Pelagovum pacificum]TNY31532.1 hypothetical protein FHY64_16110 [Pelagovum pacificum]